MYQWETQSKECVMDRPHVAGKGPAVLDLKPGTYWWCQCGLSKNQPFCDGSHKTTSFSPKKLEIDAERKVALCVCKQTGNSPMCDGSHARL